MRNGCFIIQAEDKYCNGIEIQASPFERSFAVTVFKLRDLNFSFYRSEARVVRGLCAHGPHSHVLAFPWPSVHLIVSQVGKFTWSRGHCPSTRLSTNLLHCLSWGVLKCDNRIMLTTRPTRPLIQLIVFRKRHQLRYFQKVMSYKTESLFPKFL